MAAPRQKLPLSLLAQTLLAAGALWACSDDHHAADPGPDAGPPASGSDASNGAAADSGSRAPDGASALPPDGGALDASAVDATAADAAADASAQDAASPGDSAVADAAETGPCTPGSSGCAQVTLAPFKLDCAKLPSNGVCAGGPREVLLVTEETGLIAMFDPGDGHFLGYFKHRSAKYNLEWIEGYRFADQGPDQCIWSVSGDDKARIERWNTDGSFRDVPLQDHYFNLPAAPPQPLMKASGLAFTRDKVYVSSLERSQGYPALTRWNLDGSFDRIELDGSYAIESLLVLGDGSIVYADDSRVARVPAGGGQHRPVLGQLVSPGQIAYAGSAGLLVVETSTDEPLYKVDIESGMSSRIYPKDGSQSAKYGIAPLSNGKWLLAGGGFFVTVLDPASLNPPGQHSSVFTDPAAPGIEFKQIGRACLPEAFVASRASRPANNTCIAPPDGPNIFAADFEGLDDFQGTGSARHFKDFYDRVTPGVTSSIAASEGYNGTRALKISGSGTAPSGVGQGKPNSGVYAKLPAGSRPKYVSYRVKVSDAQDRELGSFVLRNEAGTVHEYARLLSADFYHGYLRSLESEGRSETPLMNVWVRVEFRNIDWTRRTSDLYVNCERIVEGVSIPAGYGDSVDMLDLFNYPVATPNDKTVAWYDDIVIK